MKWPEWIPFHQPTIGEEEIAEVAAVLRSGWLTSGPRTKTFEDEFAAYVGAPHALAVNSCTAGLHLAMAALNIGPGDEVITTPMTFCATVTSILHAGATPVLADVGPDGNIDPAAIEPLINERTKAIIPVHLAGLPCDMKAIWEIARQHDLRVIEDAAHAVGSEHAGTRIGGRDAVTGHCSDAVVFSFYATKNLTTGEGGMVTTHDAGLAARLRLLCLHGMSRDAWNRYAEGGSWSYDVVECGFKYNLSDLQSAVGIHQLRRQEEFLRCRARYASIYNELLGDLPELELPADVPGYRHAWHLYILRLRPDSCALSRADLIDELKQQNVGTSVHFIPVPLLRFFAPYLSRERQCPRALALFSRIVSLPLYPAMTEECVRYVGSTVRHIIRSHAAPLAAGFSAASAGE